MNTSKVKKEEVFTGGKIYGLSMVIVLLL